MEDLLLKLYEQKCVELKEEVLAMMEEKVAKQQELRKNAADRKRGIDAIISRTHEPTELKKLEQKKADIDSKLEKDIGDIEVEYMRKEAQITKEVQKRCQDREVSFIADLQEKQIQEKQEIFSQHLPDSLLTELNAQMGEEDRKAMQELREQLEKQNAEKMAQLEADQKELEDELAKRQAEMSQESEIERALADRMAKRERIDRLNATEANSKITAQDQIKKVR